MSENFTFVASSAINVATSATNLAIECLCVALALVVIDLTKPKNMRAVCVVAGVGVIALALLQGRFSVILAASTVAVTITWLLRSMISKRRKTHIDTCIAVFLGAVTADLRAGATVAHALSAGVQTLSSTTPAELHKKLSAAAHVAAQGGSFERVFADAGLGDIAALCQLGSHHGIPLASLLEQAQHRLEAARRHEAKTRASLQGSQTTALVLTCLPLAGIAMGSAMGADPLAYLFGGGFGGVLLVVGVGLCCGGYAWSNVILGKAVRA